MTSSGSRPAQSSTTWAQVRFPSMGFWLAGLLAGGLAFSPSYPATDLATVDITIRTHAQHTHTHTTKKNAGNGKFLVQALLTQPIARAVGIELLSARFNKSCTALSRIAAEPRRFAAGDSPVSSSSSSSSSASSSSPSVSSLSSPSASASSSSPSVSSPLPSEWLAAADEATMDRVFDADSGAKTTTTSSSSSSAVAAAAAARREFAARPRRVEMQHGDFTRTLKVATFCPCFERLTCFTYSPRTHTTKRETSLLTISALTLGRLASVIFFFWLLPLACLSFSPWCATSFSLSLSRSRACAEIYFDDADVLYLCSTCFPPEIMNKLLLRSVSFIG